MLCQFSYKNYRSYRDETIFDFVATVADELSDTLIVDKQDGKRFLPVSVVYGPNGGGKSNLLKAFTCMVSSIVHPIIMMKKPVTSINSMYCGDLRPFLFDADSVDRPTEFEVYFRTSGVDYRYAISIFNGTIVDESLYRRAVGVKKPTKLFIRENGQIELGASLLKYKMSTAVNPEMPFLSFLAFTYSIPDIDTAAGWFESCILINYATPIGELILRLIKNPDEKKTFLSILQGLDSGIVDYKAVFDDDGQLKDIQIVRKVGSKSYALLLSEESDGTQKLFRVLPMFIDALNGGKLLVADEMDSRLHPTLLSYLIGLFSDPTINATGAQLWFTSHDLTTMQNEIFRRDEIWFAYRDADESSRIYSLYDIRTVKNAHVDTKLSYSKQYLEGRYGADPYFARIRDWRAE